MKPSKKDEQGRIKRCGQRLYEHGKLVALCIQPWGIEHDHSDKTATDAIRLGVAKSALLKLKG